MTTSTYATRVIAICVRDELELLRRHAEKHRAPPSLLDDMAAARVAIDQGLRKPGASDQELELLIAGGKRVLGELRIWVKAPDKFDR